MFAKCGFTSELTYSNCKGMTGSHASLSDSKAISTSLRTMRISVAVKSRPSIFVWKRPSPPKKHSTSEYTNFGLQTSNAEPRSGLILITLRFDGISKVWTYSPNFNICTPSTEITGDRRNKVNSLIRKLRAKRSLIISSVGMRPRTMRSWLPKSYSRVPSTGASSTAAVSTSPLSTPDNSASISACDKRSVLAMGNYRDAYRDIKLLLHHQT